MQHILRRKALKKLEVLSRKYDFDFGFVSDFNEPLSVDFKKLSKTFVLGTDPTQVLKSCKTVIVVAIPYQKSVEKSNLASFSWGTDYHYRCEEILKAICKLFYNSKYTIDSNILNERYFANKSNIGYIGKNSMFISEKYGSYCYLGLVLVDVKLQNNRKCALSCGDCDLCVKACPVDAITKQIDCTKCISERLQDRHNMNFQNLGTSVYGCDICQDVCKHNQRVKTLNIFKNIDLENSLSIDKRTYKKLFENRTFYWIGYRTFIRNVHIAYVNKFRDFSKLSFLKNSNSEYLKTVYKIIMEDENGQKKID